MELPNALPAKPPAFPTLPDELLAITLNPPTAPYTSECSIVDIVTFNADTKLPKLINFLKILTPPIAAVLPAFTFPKYPPAFRYPFTE